jgi:hypothetical protein
MSSDVSLHVLYRIANAPIQPFPFPHILVRDVFPEDYYQELLDRIPPKEAFTTLKALGRVGNGYPDTRFVLPLAPNMLSAAAEPFRSFWSEVASWLVGGSFGSMVLPKFGEILEQRFGNLATQAFYDEALLVQDYTTYALGPHTDTPSKVLSFLFYLPADDSRSHLGTSIYLPKDPNFLCPGGPHHDFDLFRRVYTMPYVPNTLFAFLKTENSFHGVEPVTDAAVRRDLLLYDIRVRTFADEGERPTTAPAAGPAPAKFSF